MQKKNISIVGFGRFGKTLYRLLQDDFTITLYDINPDIFFGVSLCAGTKKVTSLTDVYKNDTVFLAVPIALFEETIITHKEYMRDNLLIDVLSVKEHPARIYAKELKGTGARYILTHPMFGPDSSKDGFEGLSLMLHNGSATEKEYRFWKSYFKKKKLRVLEISPKEHDKQAAYSQGLTHFIGRLLENVGFERTPLDTRGAEMLHKVREQVENDTQELFLSLQTYNAYTKNMRLSLGQAYNALYNKLLSDRVRPHATVIGIQGGKGSFNEEALQEYIHRHELDSVETVLQALHNGDIDYGLFAMHNSVGGIVQESVRALARYVVTVVEEFSIPVRHFLMKRPDIKEDTITVVMAHPQVFKQCKKTLEKKYSHVHLKSGSDDMIDTARAAEALHDGRLSKRTAILGPKRLAELYTLDIIAENLQDDKTNKTSFLLVAR